MQHLILAVLWIAFCFFHSFFAAGKLKRKARDRYPAASVYYRLYYSVFAAITFIAVIIYAFSFPSFQLFVPTLFSKISGIILALVGAVIMLVCIRKYFMRITGIKTLYMDHDTANVLRIDGIHKYVRHPLYLGTFIFIWGMWLLFPGMAFLISNIIITVYTLIGIKFEEKKLEEEFGDEYRNYQQKVPMILPRLF